MCQSFAFCVLKPIVQSSHWKNHAYRKSIALGSRPTSEKKIDTIDWLIMFPNSAAQDVIMVQFSTFCRSYVGL